VIDCKLYQLETRTRKTLVFCLKMASINWSILIGLASVIESEMLVRHWTGKADRGELHGLANR